MQNFLSSIAMTTSSMLLRKKDKSSNWLQGVKDKDKSDGESSEKRPISRSKSSGNLKDGSLSRSEMDLKRSFSSYFLRNKVFRNETVLYEGGFSVVYKAFWIVGRKTVAIKKIELEPKRSSFFRFFSQKNPQLENIRAILSKSNESSNQLMIIAKHEEKFHLTMQKRPTKEQINTEVELWSLVSDSPFIVQLYDDIFYRSEFWLIMEYAPQGNLFYFVQNFQNDNLIPLKMDIIYHMFGAVLCGLTHMHKKGVIHKDIKPENIMLTDKLQPKIADFGLCVEFDIEYREEVLHGEGFDGTPCYAPPESFFSGYYNTTWDTFSVLLSMLFCKFGKICWDISDSKWPDWKIANLYVLTCKEKLEAGVWSEEDAGRHYMKKMHAIPENWPAGTNSELVSEDDFKWDAERIDFAKLAESCLAWNIDKRMTVEQLCQHEKFASSVAIWQENCEFGAEKLNDMIECWKKDDTFIDDKWQMF